MPHLLLLIGKSKIDLPSHLELWVVEDEVGLRDGALHPARPLDVSPVVNVLLVSLDESVLVAR